ARSYAKDLEGIGLLERYPGDQVKLTVKGSSHQFIEDGPLDKAIGRRDMMRFAEKLYDRRPGSTTFSTSSGSGISKKTMDELIKDMEELSTRYRLISQRERSLLPESELLEVRWAMAVVHPFQSWINELK